MDETPRPRPSLGDGYSVAGLIRAVLERGRPCRYEARGSSMHPAVKDGDVVTLRPVGAAGPRLGDIVAFVLPGTEAVRLHRVVGIADGRYLLKGDNGLVDDGEVGRQDILGAVVRIERNGRALRVGPGFLAAGLARLSRSSWFTRYSMRLRRALGLRDRKV
ncbi:MAG: S24/S26 family peptidase [Acidobacteriota bacterium]